MMVTCRQLSALLSTKLTYAYACKVTFLLVASVADGQEKAGELFLRILNRKVYFTDELQLTEALDDFGSALGAVVSESWLL